MAYQDRMMGPARDDLGAMGGGGGDSGRSDRGRRPHRHPPSAEVEAEMRLYLDKLKEIVPHIPKNRKVTRLELIQHVIDYICDLQHALEDHPGLKDEPTARFLTPPTSPHHQLQHTPPHAFHNSMPSHHLSPLSSLTSTRQPLGVISTTNTLQTSTIGWLEEWLGGWQTGGK
ncbi:achaete-scute homolog 2-like isoform X2 [Homarus americanus]|uniref:achaete-scute homolog 2-like isoform X2 n=1 Tax=Homarus americanus TaxID=6706 RepID=UPI001C437D69|nr:achaete-scute homolog 2-like isoform X2 [Homarus americanus]